MASAANSPLSQSSPRRSGSIAVSAYDRAAGWVIALLISLSTTVSVLLFIWLAGKFAKPAIRSIPVVLDDGGGSPTASDLEGLALEAPALEEVRQIKMPTPNLRETLESIDQLLKTPQPDWELSLDQLDPPAVTGGQAAGGSTQAFGEGSGSGGGVARGNRWEIHYDAGISPADYRKQLSYFGIEIAAVAADGRVEYLRFVDGKPVVEHDRASPEARLFMSWREGSPRREIDRQLLESAGLSTAGKTLAQFISAEAEQTLARLEQEFSGRDPRSIRKTRFGIRAKPGGFEFFVAEQTGL